MDILEKLAVGQAWEFAMGSKERLERNNNNDFREQIAETARSCGFKDIWLFVFKDDKDMVSRLNEVM